MRLTRIIAVGAVAAATLGLLGATPAIGHSPAAGPETQTLRALAQRHGLAVGTAVDMAALDNSADPQYRAQGHLGTQYGNFDQFSVRQTLDAFTDLGLATAFTEVDVRSQLTAGVQAGDSNEINPRLQAMAADYSVLLQACLANRHCLSYTVWGFTDKDSWVPGTFNNPAEGMATLYDENCHPKLAYQMVKADLAYLGAPLVLPRIPQRPKR